MRPSEFVALLFAAAPADLYVHTWTLESRQTAWHRVGDLDTPATAAAINQQAAGANAYVGVGLGRAALEPQRRLSSDDCAGIVGLWLDVDVAGPAHAKAGLPPTFDAGAELLADLPLQPSILLNTGGGYQAWWLFHEPLLFANAAQNEAGALLSRRWNETCQRRARAHGWALDSTHDLARLFRIGGSHNQKYTPPRAVTVEAGTRRYDVSDVEPFLADISPIAGVRVEVGQILVAERPAMDVVKLETLLESEPKVRSTWERRRRDLADDTGSGYSLSLAHYAARAGWSDQEIADLITTWRLRHGEDPKLDRPDWYRTTIGRARASRETQHNADDLGGLRYDVQAETRANPDLTAETRERALRSLSSHLGLEVTGITRYVQPDGSEPTWQMATELGPVALGATVVIDSYALFARKLAGTLKHVIPTACRHRWRDLLVLITSCSVDLDGGEDSTEGQQLLSWITEYASARRVHDEAHWQEAMAGRRFKDCYRRAGGVWLLGSDLRRWLARTGGTAFSPRQFGYLMRSAGSEPARHSNGNTSYHSWRIPAAILPALEETWGSEA